jgi:hypothetical protein
VSSPDTEDPAEIVLSLIPRQMRQTVVELRALVKEAIPNVREKPQPGWKTFNFDHNGAIASISGYQSWASIGFVRGAELADAAGILEGTGKGMRHVKVKRGATVPREALMTLLKQAARLNEELGPPKGIGRAWGGGAPDRR